MRKVSCWKWAERRAAGCCRFWLPWGCGATRAAGRGLRNLLDRPELPQPAVTAKTGNVRTPSPWVRSSSAADT
jgi:hypothetical protein